MTSQTPSGWLTLRQAAAELGVSELTLRRRVKDGKIAHRLEGGKYFVNLGLPGPGAVPRTVPQMERGDVGGADSIQVLPDQIQAAGVPTAPSMSLEAIVPELSRLAEQAGRARLLQEQVTALNAQCAELQRELVALSGRNGWLESQVQEREKDLNLLTDSQRRKGWRRLFG